MDTKPNATPKAQTSEQSNYWGVPAKDFYRALENKPVKVTLLDGKTYAGALVGFDQYDIALKQASGLTMLTAKHAIVFIVPATTAE
jgi:sRNA-binding regulator protein Hfq